MGLVYVKPITLAGMRYSTAFMLLIPIMAYRGELKCNLARNQWIQLFAMGLCAFTIANGALFWGLKYLPAITGSFLFSLLPLPVLFLGIIWLGEMPKRWQVVGFLATLGGSVLFFSPGLHVREPLAVGVVSLGVVAFSFYGVLSRNIQALIARGSHHPLPCGDQYDLCLPSILPFPPSADGSGASCSP